MTLKSLSAKLYLGIAVAAVVAWVAGVPGRTILSLVAVGLMMAMHAGGHGGHGGHGRGGGGDGHGGHAATDPPAIHRAGAGPKDPSAPAGQDQAVGYQSGSDARGSLG